MREELSRRNKFKNSYKTQQRCNKIETLIKLTRWALFSTVDVVAAALGIYSWVEVVTKSKEWAKRNNVDLYTKEDRANNNFEVIKQPSSRIIATFTKGNLKTEREIDSADALK